MASRDGTNAFVAIGIVLLVVGGLGFVYGQMSIQDQQNDGGFIDIDDDQGNLDGLRMIRILGLFTGVVGVVMAVVGGLLE